MPPRTESPDVIRLVEGKRGHVDMRMELVIRFDYGSLIPWVTRVDNGLIAIGGPDALRLNTPVRLVGENFHTVADFTVGAGDKVPFSLTWFPSHRAAPHQISRIRASPGTTVILRYFPNSDVLGHIASLLV